LKNGAQILETNIEGFDFMLFLLVEGGFGSYEEIIKTDTNKVFDMFEFMSIRAAQKIVLEQEHQRKIKNGK
jgi:hypothetical protein